MEKLPWWPENTSRSNLLHEIDQYCKAQGSASYNEDFSRWTAIQSIIPHQSKALIAIDAILYSALDEGCIQDAFLTKHELGVLEAIFTNASSEDIVASSRKLELLCRHMRALKYMLYSGHNVITVKIIMETHRIMMMDDEYGGSFRSGPVYGGNFQYLSSDQIPSSMESALESHNDRVRMKSMDPIDLAAKLFYDIVHRIHPFQDGNGRIGRLIVSYVLMSSNVTSFALPFNDRTTKSRKHYEKAISYFSRLEKPYSMLSLYILDCTHKCWNNYYINIHPHDQQTFQCH
jgi:fido (protein-threonine AMPylation protein)